MEQKIITVEGLNYLLQSDVPLTQEQIEYTVSQLSIKTLSKTCITAATVGQNLSLQNTIQSGNPPYNVSIKKDTVVIQSWTATYTLTQSINYQLQSSDFGTRRFSVDVTDSCSTGAKSTTEFCDVVVSPAVTADTTPPSIPTNLHAVSVSATEFNLIWDASVDPIVTGQVTSGMKEYNIYRNGVLWATSIQTTVTVTVSTTTQYTISAVDNANNESAQCSSISVSPAVTICSWITGIGGWNVISAYNIMTLVSAYAGATNLGFTVAAIHIMGAVAYYAAKGTGSPSAGNNLTGCAFT